MRVTIIGGGAAGLMTAASLVEHHPSPSLTLIDRNDALGKKVVISGGGRCNVTTGFTDVPTMLTKYPRGSKFLASAMHRFPPQAVMAWFEAHGVPLKTEDDLRVFPVSDNGHDVVQAFVKLFHTTGVNVRLKSVVTGVAKPGNQFLVTLKGQAEPVASDALVLTTGGQAYRQTGSTGDGYAFAAALGHTVTPLAPSLSSFTTQEPWPKELAGLSFERAKLTCERPPHASYTGPFLFTHRGISGPAVFALSSLTAFETYSAAAPLPLSIDVLPDTPTPELTHQLEQFVAANPKKSLANTLATLAPKSLVEVLLRELGLPGERHAAELSKKDTTRALAWLKHVPLNAVGRGAGDEFVTAGGVQLTEVNPSTMESKVCPGLYFAGELLNVDGFTGGFNLQASWATGHLVGESLTA